MIRIENLQVNYDSKVALNKVTLDFKSGVIGIVGPNGSGKTTLLKAINSLVEYKGNVLIDDKNTKLFSSKEISKRVALFAQSNSNYFTFTVYETILQGRFPFSSGLFGYSKEDHSLTDEIISQLDLNDFKDRNISSLSGGELQRVFLARALVQNPEVLLLDEPTNHLDLSYQVEILDYIVKWASEKNRLVLAVLHDLNLVQKYADYVALLNEGNLIKYGSKSEVLGSNELTNVYKFNVKEWNQDILMRWMQC